MLRYLLFILIGIILFLILNNLDRFSIGGFWAIPMKGPEFNLDEIYLHNTQRIGTIPRETREDGYEGPIEVNRIYLRYGNLNETYNYFFVTDIEPIETTPLQDQPELLQAINTAIHDSDGLERELDRRNTSIRAFMRVTHERDERIAYEYLDAANWNRQIAVDRYREQEAEARPQPAADAAAAPRGLPDAGGGACAVIIPEGIPPERD